MRYLLLALGLFTTYVFATEPIQVPRQEWSSGLARLSVCDTPEQMASVITAHREGGLEAGAKRFHELGQEPGIGGPACGIATGRFLVVSAVWEGEVDGEPAFIGEVALILPDGTPIPMPLFGAFLGAVLVDAADVGKSSL